MKTLALFLLTAATLAAQPRIEVITEHLPTQTLGVWNSHDVDGTDGRTLYFMVGFTNSGNATWMPSMADLGTDWLGWFYAVQDFYYVTLSDMSGHILAEQSKSHAGAVRVLRPGDVISGDYPFFDGLWVKLPQDMAAGDYMLQIVVDPFNKWRLFNIRTLRVRIDGFDAEVVE